MKQFLAIFILFLISFQIADIGVVYLWFKINQSYIATVLCINKEEPEMQCNGKCQLNKAIIEQDNQDKETNEFPFQIERLVMNGLISSVQDIQLKTIASFTSYFSFDKLGVSTEFISPVFHPPTAANYFPNTLKLC